MFAKLLVLIGACFLLSAQAQTEPVHFRDLEAARQWFSKSYPSHKFEKRVVKTSSSREFEVFAFYAPRGSGVITMDGWYYACTKASWAAAGSADTDLSFLSFLELYRTDVAERRVTTGWVVEPLDVVEHVGASLFPGPVHLSGRALSLQ